MPRPSWSEARGATRRIAARLPRFAVTPASTFLRPQVAFHGGQCGAGQVACQRVEDPQIIHAFQPGQLPLGKLARGKHAAIAQLGARQGPFQHAPDLAIADAAHRGQAAVEPVLAAQHQHFLDQAGIQHGVEALFDASVQCAAIFRDQRQHQDTEGRRAGLLCGKEAAQGAAGEAQHLDGTLDALRIGGLQARSGFRVQARQFGMQGRPAVGGGFDVDCGAQSGIRLRQVCEAFAQRFHIQHGAAHQQRNAARRGDVRHLAQRIAAEGCRGITFFRRDQVDQAVRKARQRRRIGLGGADVHVAEHLRRVDADDVAGKARGEFKSQGGLAAGRGSDEEYCRGLAHAGGRRRLKLVV